MSDERYERVFGIPRFDPNDKKKNQPSNSNHNEIEDESKNLLKFSKAEPIAKKDKDTSGLPKPDKTHHQTKQSEDAELDLLYDRMPKPQTQMEVGEEELLSKLKNHIVVCGIHSSIMHFILPLRAKYLKNQ